MILIMIKYDKVLFIAIRCFCSYPVTELPGNEESNDLGLFSSDDIFPNVELCLESHVSIQ